MKKSKLKNQLWCHFNDVTVDTSPKKRYQAEVTKVFIMGPFQSKLHGYTSGVDSHASQNPTTAHH